MEEYNSLKENALTSKVFETYPWTIGKDAIEYINIDAKPEELHMVGKNVTRYLLKFPLEFGDIIENKLTFEKLNSKVEINN